MASDGIRELFPFKLGQACYHCSLGYEHDWALRETQRESEDKVDTLHHVL
jgi:hypothetical protein